MNDYTITTQRDLPETVKAFDGAFNFEVVPRDYKLNGYALLSRSLRVYITPDVKDHIVALRTAEEELLARFEDPGELRILSFTDSWTLVKGTGPHDPPCYLLTLILLYKGLPGNWEPPPLKLHATEDEGAITNLVIQEFTPAEIDVAFDKALKASRQGFVLDMRISAALFAVINKGPTNIFDGFWQPMNANTETGLVGILSVKGSIPILVYTDTFKDEYDKSRLPDNTFLIVGFNELARVRVEWVP